MFAGAVRALSVCGRSRPLRPTSGAAPPRFPLLGRFFSRPFASPRPPPPTPSSVKDDVVCHSSSFGMENEWPPFKECVQYKLDLLRPYFRNFEWEHDDGDEMKFEYQRKHVFDSDSDSDSDTEDDSYDTEGFTPIVLVGYKPSTLREFVKQVRESRGYDYDMDGESIPRYMCNPFVRCDEYLMRACKKYLNAGIELAIKHINSKTGKVYKHVDTLSVVHAMGNRCFLFTFTAKVVSDKEVAVETFLATVYSPGLVFHEYKLLECLLKPKGPAPWAYVDW